MRLPQLWNVVKETAKDWSDDDAPTLAAALAYYALLSLAPLLVISIGIAGWFLGTEAARGGVTGQLSGIVGGEAAEGIQAVVASAREPERGVIGPLRGRLPPRHARRRWWPGPDREALESFSRGHRG